MSIRPQVRDILLQCKAPAYVLKDKLDRCTQEEYVQYLLASAELIWMSPAEAQEILEGKISKAALWTHLGCGRAHVKGWK
jgi:hypothetical protein